MQMFILTLQENIFDVHHLVDFPMTVDNMTVANVSHSASMTHSCMHHSTIVAAWVVRSKAATVRYFWITHSCLI